jgi:hypothetical protein
MTQFRSSFTVAALVLTSLASIFVYRVLSAPNADPSRDLAVSCGAGHRAVVRQVAGQHSVAVDCVPGESPVPAASFISENELAGFPSAPRPVPRMMPVAYAPAEAVTPRVQPASINRAPVRRESPRRVERKTSWQKRALAIGGAAGAGAGIGALVGGKKGALVGAAVGGGGAAAIDFLKR